MSKSGYLNLVNETQDQKVIRLLKTFFENILLPELEVGLVRTSPQTEEAIKEVYELLKKGELL